MKGLTLARDPTPGKYSVSFEGGKLCYGRFEEYLCEYETSSTKFST